MSISRHVTRAFAPLIALIVALGAFAALSVTSATTAEAASKPTVKITTKGPYKKNQTIKVKVSGFPANTSLGIGTCRAGVDPNGPGDCGPSSKGYSKLVRTDANGGVKFTLRVPKGKLLSPNLPKVKCSNKKSQKCTIHASTIAGTSIWKQSPVLKYS